jgi:hypothetical protein
MYLWLLSHMDFVVAPYPHPLSLLQYFLSCRWTRIFLQEKVERIFLENILVNKLEIRILKTLLFACNTIHWYINIITIFWLSWNSFVWGLYTRHWNIWTSNRSDLSFLYIFWIEALSNCISLMHTSFSSNDCLIIFSFHLWLQTLLGMWTSFGTTTEEICTSWDFQIWVANKKR